MASGRLTRILLALAITTLVLYIAQKRNGPPAERSTAPIPGKSHSRPGGGDESKAKSPILEEAGKFQEGGDVPALPSNAQLVPDAHKLPFADAFLSHFEAVTRLKGISAQEAMQTCTWGADEPVNFQYVADTPWVVRQRPEEELQKHRREWQSFVDSGMIPYDLVKSKFEGRGVVIVAGNQDTLKRVKVLLRQLKRLRSKIAVELHHWDDEMSEDSKKELENMYQPVFFNDLSKGHNIIRIKKDGFWINYQLKTAALVNSRFAEPLLLDSDNIPVINPEELYDSFAYQEYGAVFWPDVARTRPQNPVWALTNTPCRMDEYEQESGQLLVDKTRYWYHLQLASWMNNEQGAYYNDFLLGDKDMFRFAWHALKTPFGRPKKWVTSVGTVNAGDYCGHSFAQHHPDDGRVAFLHGGLVKTVSPEVMKWNREHGGFYRNYKRVPTDENPGHNVNVGIKFDGAPYMESHSSDFQYAQCIDMFDVEPAPLDELIPGWEQTFEEIGGYWQLDSPKGREGKDGGKGE